MPPKVETPAAPHRPRLRPAVEPPAAVAPPCRRPPPARPTLDDAVSAGGAAAGALPDLLRDEPAAGQPVRPGRPAASGVKGVAATVTDPVYRPAPEGAGFFGPIGSALTLDIPAEAIPPALFAMAALAILLLALASAPVPARTSRTGRHARPCAPRSPSPAWPR